jgi:hypothetical protein
MACKEETPAGMGVPAGVGFRAWVGRLRVCQDAGEAANVANVTEGTGGRNNVKTLGIFPRGGAVLSRSMATSRSEDLTQRTRRKGGGHGESQKAKSEKRKAKSEKQVPRCARDDTFTFLGMETARRWCVNDDGALKCAATKPTATATAGTAIGFKGRI